MRSALTDTLFPFTSLFRSMRLSTHTRMPAGLAGAASSVAIGAAGGAAAAEKVEWNLSVWGPARAYTAGVESLARHVEETSGGNFTLQVHYGQAISPAKEEHDGMKLSAFEIDSICTGYPPGKHQQKTGMTFHFLPS